MSDRLLVFAGTFEGHALAQHMSETGMADRADFCVATDYGTEMIEDLPGINVLEGRKNEDEIVSLLKDGNYSAVVDATHPYAAVVTENIRKAAEETGVEYIRLLREEIDFSLENVVRAASIDDAIDMLNKTDERVLLTTGSKELHKFTRVKNHQERLVARVLPSIESLELAKAAGILPKNTIAMQGPFTEEMNLATIDQYGCSTLVTKNTGKPGGFKDKLSCARNGVKIIVIDRPLKEKGLSLEQVIERIDDIFGK